MTHRAPSLVEALEDALSLRVYVNNPSAWDQYDEAISEQIRSVVASAAQALAAHREREGLTYEEAEALALKAIRDTDGRGMVGYARHHLHQRVARAILAAHGVSPTPLGDGNPKRADHDGERSAGEKPPSEFLLIRIPHAEGGEVTVEPFEDSGALQDALLKAQKTGWYADVLGLYRHGLTSGKMGKWWCGPWTGYAKRFAKYLADKAPTTLSGPQCEEGTDYPTNLSRASSSPRQHSEGEE